MTEDKGPELGNNVRESREIADRLMPGIWALAESTDLSDMLALCDLLEFCKHPEHVLSERSRRILDEVGLITITSDGRIGVHDTIHNIILSTVKVEAGVVIVSQYANEDED